MTRALRFSRVHFASAALLFLALAAPACDSGPELVQTLEMTIPSNVIRVGQSIRITATPKSAAGKVLARDVQYQSSAPQVAAVQADGTIIGVGAGGAVIMGLADGATASVSVSVLPVPVAKVRLSLDSATLSSAATLQLTATPLDSAGFSLFDRVVAWSSSDPLVATVTQTGLVTGVGAGRATIAAAIEGKTAQAVVTVIPPPIASIDISPQFTTVTEGATAQFSATVRDLGGHVLTGRRLVWTSSDTSRAKVDSTGLARTFASGTVNILATGGGVLGGAALNIRAVVIGSVAITPDTATIPVDSTVQLTATIRDTTGRVVTTRKPAWRSVDPAIATVAADGKVTGVAAGTTEVIAEASGHADTAQIAVYNAMISSIELSPLAADLGLGKSGRLGVTLRDYLDQVVPFGIRLQWESADSSVAVVDSAGVITGVSTGTARILASGGGASAGANVTVVTTTVSSVTVTEQELQLVLGQPRQIVPTAFDAVGNTLLHRLFTFTSSNRSVAIVDTKGRIVAVGVGTAAITVSSEGGSTVIAVTVQ